MGKRMRTLKAGEVVVVSSGAYSDYGIHGIYRLTQDIDPDGLCEQWLEIHPDLRKEYEFDEYDFIAWVLKEHGEAFEQIEAVEWHLGDYGNLERMSVKDQSWGLAICIQEGA